MINHTPRNPEAVAGDLRKQVVQRCRHNSAANRALYAATELLDEAQRLVDAAYDAFAALDQQTRAVSEPLPDDDEGIAERIGWLEAAEQVLLRVAAAHEITTPADLVERASGATREAKQGLTLIPGARPDVRQQLRRADRVRQQIHQLRIQISTAS